MASPFKLLAVTVAAGALAVPALAADGAGSPSTSDLPVGGSVETVPVECGGYDEDGTLVEPRAIEVTEAPVNDDGLVEVPPFCGGWTEDGEFVGVD